MQKWQKKVNDVKICLELLREDSINPKVTKITRITEICTLGIKEMSNFLFKKLDFFGTSEEELKSLRFESQKKIIVNCLCKIENSHNNKKFYTEEVNRRLNKLQINSSQKETVDEVLKLISKNEIKKALSLFKTSF